jgi:hypothetical protein
MATAPSVVRIKSMVGAHSLHNHKYSILRFERPVLELRSTSFTSRMKIFPLQQQWKGTLQAGLAHVVYHDSPETQLPLQAHRNSASSTCRQNHAGRKVRSP